MANSDLGQFGPRPLINSDPIKTRSVLTNVFFLKIGSELAKVRINFRSELTKVQTKVRSKFTQVRIELRSELTKMFKDKGNLPFYMLLSLLYSEACVIPTQVKMVKEGKLRRYQHKHAKGVQAKIAKLWERYADKEISTSPEKMWQAIWTLLIHSPSVS